MKRIRVESESPSWEPTDNFGKPCERCKKGQYINDPKTGQLKCSDCGEPKDRWSV